MEQKFITDEQGNRVLPITHVNAVRDDNGNTVATLLGNKANASDVTTALSGKQDTINDLSTIRSGATAGATAYQKPQAGIPSTDMSAAVRTSLGKADEVDVIKAKIPSAATDQNQLADMAFVNSSIATATANFKGSFNLVSDLSLTTSATHTQIGTALGDEISGADNNDYCFVQIPTADATPTVIAKVERYKFDGTVWAYEYDLNNSGFTAAQWAALNSGITNGQVAKLSDLPTNTELTEALGGKVDKVSGKGLSTNDYTTEEKTKLGALPTNADLTTALANKADKSELSVFDISVYNNATYADLAAALGTNGANVPASVRKGGMSVKYVQSSDNKYVQYRYIGTDVTTAATFTNVINWQGVDVEPIVGSNNLVKSGGVYENTAYDKIIINSNNSSKPFRFKAGYLYRVKILTSNITRIASLATRETSDGENIDTIASPAFPLVTYNIVPTVDANYLRVGLITGEVNYVDIEITYIGKSLKSFVDTNEQTLTNEQKKQVIKNLGLDDVYSQKILGTLVLLSTLQMTQGGITALGNNADILNNVRVGDSVYVNGVFDLKLPDGFVFRRVLYYSKSDKTLLYQEAVNSQSISIGKYNSNECYTRFSVQRNDESNFTVADLIPNDFYASIINGIDNIDGKIDANYKIFTDWLKANAITLTMNAGIMLTGHNVGDTASFEITTPINWEHIKLPVKEGEAYYISNARSGNNPEAVTLTDSNGVIKEIIHTDIGQPSDKYTGVLFVKYNGYLVVNGVIDDVSTYNLNFVQISSDLSNKINNLTEDVRVRDTLNILDSAGLYQGGLSVSGKEVDTSTQIRSGAIRPKTYIELPEGFLIRRIVYYNDVSGAFDSYMDIGVNAAYIGKDNCYARISIRRTGVTETPISPEDFPVSNLGAQFKEEVKKTTELFYQPIVHFNVDYTLGDFATEIAGVDFGNVNTDSLFMEQIYQKIDTLISQNSDYITKYDAAELAGLEYPEYANGINSEVSRLASVVYGDDFPSDIEDYTITYRVTPAYKTYIYKLSYTNTHIYSAATPKRKIFITACNHGWETAGSFNAYLLMKNLCEKFADNDFFMKLRTTFEIWIMPCLNGYGIYHGTRVNANGVNINRNAPTSNWHLYNSYTNANYTGPFGGSEFETKLFMYFLDTIKPDMYIDHHCFAGSPRIFYTEGNSPLLQNPAFAAIVDINHCLLKNLPAYFGTAYDIFQHYDELDCLPVRLDTSAGMLAVYSAEVCSPFSIVLEVCNLICYSNGQYDLSANQKNTNDTYKVAEYSFRNQLTHYLNALLEYSRRKNIN